jgi:hypothetical protein
MLKLRNTRRAIAMTAATLALAGGTAVGAGGTAHAASCYNSGNLVQLGPTTPVTASNFYGSTTLGYFYIGWDRTSLCSYAEIDWINGWQNNAYGTIYLNWNDPAHNSAEGKVSFNTGQSVSWVSKFLYQGPGTAYTPGRSFTAAAVVSVDVCASFACEWLGPKTITGSTHDFSNGWNSGPGSADFHY